MGITSIYQNNKKKKKSGF
ncbi:hypothetical protein [Cognataquiflexum rubidum]